MILKTLKRNRCASSNDIGDVKEWEFVDNISYIQITDGRLTGKWNNRDEKWEDPVSLKDYEEVYLLNNEGKTIERLI